MGKRLPRLQLAPATMARPAWAMARGRARTRLRVAAMGDVDELNSTIGVLLTETDAGPDAQPI